MGGILAVSRPWRSDEMMKHGAAVVLLLNACLVSAVTGRISGTVVDEYGNPVPHVIVEAVPTNVELVQTMSKATTDANGWFVLRVDAGREPDGIRWDVYPSQPTSYFRWSLDNACNRDISTVDGLPEVFPFIAVENDADDMTRVVDAYFRHHREIEIVALCIGPVHLIQPLSNLHDAKDVA